MTAIHDAVSLANWISTLRSPSNSDLDTIFTEYRAERYPIIMEALQSSVMFGANVGNVRE